MPLVIEASAFAIFKDVLHVGRRSKSYALFDKLRSLDRPRRLFSVGSNVVMVWPELSSHYLAAALLHIADESAVAECNGSAALAWANRHTQQNVWRFATRGPHELLFSVFPRTINKVAIHLDATSGCVRYCLDLPIPDGAVELGASSVRRVKPDLSALW